jgi:hypothetical protein
VSYCSHKADLIIHLCTRSFGRRDMANTSSLLTAARARTLLAEETNAGKLGKALKMEDECGHQGEDVEAQKVRWVKVKVRQ